MSAVEWTLLIAVALAVSCAVGYGLTYAITRWIQSGRRQFERSWSQFSREIGGELLNPVHSRGLYSDVVRAPCRQWTIILDCYRIADEDVIGAQDMDRPLWWTRVRVPYLGRSSFVFSIYREDAYSKFGRRLLGERALTDIDVGDLGFDQSFSVTGSDEAEVRALLDNPQIRRLLQLQPHVKMGLGRAPGDPWDRQPTSELYCKRGGLVTDLDQLRSLYELVTETFQQLYAMGAVADEPPKLAQDSYRK